MLEAMFTRAVATMLPSMEHRNSDRKRLVGSEISASATFDKEATIPCQAYHMKIVTKRHVGRDTSSAVSPSDSTIGEVGWPSFSSKWLS